MNHFGRQFPMSHTVASQLLCHDLARLIVMAFQQAFEKTLCSLAVSTPLHKHINDFAILIHSTPQILLLASDLYENFVDEDSIAVASMRSPQSACVPGIKLTAPQSDRFTAGLDPPVSQQVFDISVTDIEAVIQPYRVLDDIRWKSVTLIAAGESVHLPIVAQR